MSIGLLFFIYGSAGALAGFMAGLLGIGGGAIIVPIMIFTFPLHGISDNIIMPMALGTSLAAIIFSAISSSLTHHRHSAVRWDIVRLIAPGIVIGTFGGAAFASHLSPKALKIIFIVFLIYISYKMISGKKPEASRELPGKPGLFSVGGLIGLVSSFVGIGGGSLSVPFMVWCNISLHVAIGTSAAIGFFIALSGAAGYIVNGLGNPLMPAYSLGFVYLPALAGIVVASVMTAPLGARLAHKLPVEKLRIAFALLLGSVAVKMTLGIFGN